MARRGSSPDCWPWSRPGSCGPGSGGDASPARSPTRLPLWPTREGTAHRPRAIPLRRRPPAQRRRAPGFDSFAPEEPPDPAHPAAVLLRRLCPVFLCRGDLNRVFLRGRLLLRERLRFALLQLCPERVGSVARGERGAQLATGALLLRSHGQQPFIGDLEPDGDGHASPLAFGQLTHPE